MPNKKAYPRLFTHVIQAVAGMREAKGSTVRKIVEQVNSSISISNLRPKPRNVVMQVRKAIQHGIETGMLRQKAGKVFLTLRHSASPVHSRRRSRSKSPRISSRSKRRRARNKNRNVSEKGADQLTRKAKKGRKKKRGRRRKQELQQQQQQRARAPSRKSRDSLKVDDENEVKSERSKRTSYHCLDLPQDQTEEPINNIDNDLDENPCNVCARHSATCDNPECICNIKQEPVEQDEDLHEQDS